MAKRTRLVAGLLLATKIGIVAFLVMGVTTTATVSYTARSDFCRSCHIMEPYFQSWKHSPHANVDCVDCHYEPGLLETVEGKFKALSQLAKYATQTQGTKPWAEVSDSSCMRSGCHSERLLDGEIKFDRIRFDHKHHLLESRRGKRLRCTSCHTQVQTGSHMDVTKAACFLCHFRTSEESASHGDCKTCHGAPKEELTVDGVAFRHGDYVGRGVACDNCHRNVTRGDGLAHKKRCSSCHGAEEHIQRFGDTEFIHEQHVTLHKVECTECHDDIEHGLLDRHGSEKQGECGNCHQSRHDVQWMLYAGQGAKGVEASPSAMYRTRVDCAACHKDFWATGGHGGKPGQPSPPTDVACMHCHGSEFGWMLDAWRNEVKAALPPIEAALSKLTAPAGDTAAAALLADARANVDLVKADGSFGVHNIGYVLAMLRKAKDGVNDVGRKVDPAFESLKLDIGPPAKSATRCSDACHVDIGRHEPRFGEVAFKHRPHLTTANLDCDACHSLDEHGKTTMTKQDCTSCHHDVEKTDSCAKCHDQEERLLRGTITVEGATLEMANTMGKLNCTDCHRELGAKDPHTLMKAACVDCHKPGYDAMIEEWQTGTKDELEPLRPRLAALADRLTTLPPTPARTEARTLLDKARFCFAAATEGRPLHNPFGALSLAAAAAQFLDQAEALLR